MADPCEADLAVGEIREEGVEMFAEALGEERGDEDLGEEVALVPAFLRAQSDPPSFRRGAGRLLGGGRTGFAGNFFPFFHSAVILSCGEAGAKMIRGGRNPDSGFRNSKSEIRMGNGGES